MIVRLSIIREETKLQTKINGFFEAKPSYE